MSKPLVVCFEAHAKDGKVWAVRYGMRWHRAKRVRIDVPMTTIYRGPDARQPKAYLRGHGSFRMVDGCAILA